MELQWSPAELKRSSNGAEMKPGFESFERGVRYFESCGPSPILKVLKVSKVLKVVNVLRGVETFKT